MRIDILTLFPEMCNAYLSESIIGRARKSGKVQIECKDIRNYTKDKHRRVDDTPYGGGMGMIMQVEPVFDCFEALCSEIGERPHLIYLTPQGKTLTQQRVKELSKMNNIALLCGHYEGVDRRFEDHTDEMISLGDYILTGGELPAMCITDSIARLLKGALREGATSDESHENGLLEYPQYTKPVDWNGEKVPEILLSGNHGAIDKWRRVQALRDTRKYRPDMFMKYEMSEEEKKWLSEADQNDE